MVVALGVGLNQGVLVLVGEGVGERVGVSVTMGSVVARLREAEEHPITSATVLNVITSTVVSLRASLGANRFQRPALLNEFPSVPP